eukprot:3611563-Pleurochrysis_carterae.AAC.1
MNHIETEMPARLRAGEADPTDWSRAKTVGLHGTRPPPAAASVAGSRYVGAATGKTLRRPSWRCTRAAPLDVASSLLRCQC